MTGAIPAWVECYRGKPFRRDADGPDAYDCYGLVRAALRNEWGLDTPALDGAWHLEAAQSLLAALGATDSPWIELRGEAQPGDVLVFLGVPGVELHVGIVVAPGWMLHAREDHGVETSRLDRPAVAATRHTSHFRHRGMVRGACR